MQAADALAREYIYAAARSGLVEEAAEGEVTVRCPDSLWHGQVAASCLLRPQAGDEVLLAPLADGRAFILAVLTRAGKGPACLDFPQGVEIESPGLIGLRSQGSLELSAPYSRLTAGELKVEAGEIKASAGVCGLLARTLRAAGEKLENTFARFRGRYDSSSRIVSGHDDTQAGSSRLSAEGGVQVQAGNIHHTAQDMVRIDSRQVHIS
jgi:hypothetical protein